ncbi:MAG: hypothetical protein DCC58_01610 [Chloroflexi bacterium]|nr:MAG: hypothetical protein DCC58_01610 [Chloroflexota bacterium]
MTHLTNSARRHRVLILCLALLLSKSPAFAVTSTAATPSPDLCAEPTSRYQLTPSDRRLFPTAAWVEAPSDLVSNVGALLAEDGAATTIVRSVEESPVVIIDFGKVVSGRVSMQGSSATSATLRLAFSESLRFLRPESDTDWGEQGSILWAPGPGPAQIELPQRTFRYLRLSLESPGSIDISGVSMLYTPAIAQRGDIAACFFSSDDRLNRIWYGGAYTLALNTVQTADGNTVIIDGAKRDQMIWTADLAVQAQVGYTLGANPAAVRASLADLAAHQRADGSIPPSPYGGYSLTLYDYCAWWVIALADYVRSTGDVAFAEQQYEAMRRQMAWFTTLPRSNGLLVKDAGLEWSYTLQRSGAVTYLNVVYARALADAAELATMLGHAAAAAAWQAQATDVARLINVHLFDPQRGVYVASDNDHEHIPLDANALAIVFGIAPPQAWPGILGYLQEHHWTAFGSVTVAPAYGSNTWHDQRIWPFASYFEVLARFIAGDDDNAWELLRRVWGHMLTADPASTTWEWMTANGEIEDGFASLAHGWSAGATAALSAYALGVRPASNPGDLLIDPRPGDLDWARGRVPTIHGPVDVSWWSFDGGFALRVVIPKGAAAQAALPLISGGATVLQNGVAVSRDAGTVSGDRFLLALPPGEHTLLVVDSTQFYPETGQYLSRPFEAFWAANGGIPVFGYPLTAAYEAFNGDDGGFYLVQYVERQRLEFHPELSGTPYVVLLGRLGAADAERRGLIGSGPFLPSPASNNPSCRWFAPTEHNVCGRFLEYWSQHGLEFGDPEFSERESLALFGYPISEPYVDAESGLLVQYFERARFEYHPANAGTPWDVLLGRLGADAVVTLHACCTPAGAR